MFSGLSKHIRRFQIELFHLSGIMMYYAKTWFLDVCTALVNFMERSVMTSSNWLMFIVFRKDSSMCIATKSKWSLAEKSCGRLSGFFTTCSRCVHAKLSKYCSRGFPYVARNVCITLSRTYVSSSCPANAG